jgi:G3E family GTPase
VAAELSDVPQECGEGRAPRSVVEMSSPPATKKQKLAIADLLAPAAPRAPESDSVAPALLTADRTWAAATRIQSQIPTAGVPLTILTGFLGAGKSTILNYILRAPHNLRVAVLINEYGAIDIDSQLVDTSTSFKEGDPIVLDNGCICCTVSNGFIDAIRRILESAAASDAPPDYIIVETTGLADPKAIIDSVQETELRGELYVDQVLTAVDASVWSEDHYGSATARRQIEVADTVLLTKTDLVTSGTKVDAVITSIQQIRPNARILRSQAGHVPIHALFDLDIKPKAKAGPLVRSERVEGKPVGEERANEGRSEGDGESCGHDRGHDGGHGSCPHASHGHGSCKESGDEKSRPKSHLEEEGFTSVSFVSKNALSLSRFRRDFMEDLPDGVFRAKGLLWFNNYPSRFIFHWSGSRYNVDEGDWPEGTDKSNQLVVIGRNLDCDRITAMLELCVARPGEDESDRSDGGEEGEEGSEGSGYSGGDGDACGGGTAGETVGESDARSGEQGAANAGGGDVADA